MHSGTNPTLSLEPGRLPVLPSLISCVRVTLGRFLLLKLLILLPTGKDSRSLRFYMPLFVLFKHTETEYLNVLACDIVMQRLFNFPIFFLFYLLSQANKDTSCFVWCCLIVVLDVSAIVQKLAAQLIELALCRDLQVHCCVCGFLHWKTCIAVELFMRLFIILSIRLRHSCATMSRFFSIDETVRSDVQKQDDWPQTVRQHHFSVFVII